MTENAVDNTKIIWAGLTVAEDAQSSAPTWRE